MNERIIENWLTSVNEKSFQTPFCQMLIAENYQVVHLSRHGSFEEGKDVLAIAPDGTPCAFQLKGADSGRISQTEWSKYHDQIYRLVEIPIIHPSIDESKERRVYFVTNGDLEEEVRTEIHRRNSDWEKRGHPKLETIVKGELLSRFKQVHTNLWPINIQIEKELLGLYLADGKSYLKKPDYTQFIEHILFSNEKPSPQEGKRIIASLALLVTYALYPYTVEQNFVAIIEGLTIFSAYIVSFVEKHNLDKRYWKNTITIIEKEIELNLLQLCDELKFRKHLVEGNPLVDTPFYRGRLTWLMGYVSAYVILLCQREYSYVLEKWYFEFLLENIKLLELWGEGAIPQLLSIVWGVDILGYKHISDRLLASIFISIINTNKQGNGLPDPYEEFPKVVLNRLGLDEIFDKNTFVGRSYTLQSLTYMIANRDFRGLVNQYWKPLTNISFCKFTPENIWEYCIWHCENGLFNDELPIHQKSWGKLSDESKSVNLNLIPKYFQDNPEMLLLYIIAVPHRLCPNVVSFLDQSFRKIYF